MYTRFESEEVYNTIENLALQTGRKFRPGNPIELLLFKQQHPELCPRYFVAIGKVWRGKVLVWYHGDFEFELYDLDGHWDGDYQIFIVEDL